MLDIQEAARRVNGLPTPGPESEALADPALARWVVKCRQYTGGTSVVGLFDTEDEARESAAVRNAAYQSDNYYIEEWQEALC